MRGISQAHRSSKICMKRLALAARLSRIDHFNIQKWGVEVNGTCAKTGENVWRAVMQNGTVQEWKGRDWVRLSEGVCSAH